VERKYSRYPLFFNIRIEYSLFVLGNMNRINDPFYQGVEDSMSQVGRVLFVEVCLDGEDG
jgi:hypothetical protein